MPSACSWMQGIELRRAQMHTRHALAMAVGDVHDPVRVGRKLRTRWTDTVLVTPACLVLDEQRTETMLVHCGKSLGASGCG